MREVLTTPHGETIEVDCKECGRGMGNVKGRSDGRYTMLCACGVRVHIITFPGERVPYLLVWKIDTPEGIAFNDYLQAEREAHRANYFCAAVAPAN